MYRIQQRKLEAQKRFDRQVYLISMISLVVGFIVLAPK